MTSVKQCARASYVEIYWFLSISTTDVTTFVATDAFCALVWLQPQAALTYDVASRKRLVHGMWTVGVLNVQLWLGTEHESSDLHGQASQGRGEAGTYEPSSGSECSGRMKTVHISSLQTPATGILPSSKHFALKININVILPSFSRFSTGFPY
jgi:hypothetical protein